MQRKNDRSATATPDTRAAREPNDDDGSRNRPIFSVGPIMTDPNNSVSAAVWEREVKLEDGREFTTHSVSCEATYRDKEGNWQKSGNYRSNQIPTLIYCLQRCFEWVQGQRDPKQNAE